MMLHKSRALSLLVLFGLLLLLLASCAAWIPFSTTNHHQCRPHPSTSLGERNKIARHAQSTSSNHHDDEETKEDDKTNTLSRRAWIVQSMAGLSAEAAWRQAVQTAAMASVDNVGLPADTISQIQAGRAVIVPNWLSAAECQALRHDIQTLYATGEGYFKNFVLSRNPSKADYAANDRWIMSSFSKATGKDGPFADPTVGNFAARQDLKAKMAAVKAFLSKGMHDLRPTLEQDVPQTHEMEYLRYGPGAFLQRHTDEHHIELQYAGGSARPKKPNASRRSVTWMVYVNEPDWDASVDGGQLRLHERASASPIAVGARGPHLQVGWLKANAQAGLPEQPVFLDPNRQGPENETCMLFTYDPVSGRPYDLSSKPFANACLYLGGGDLLARRFMVESPADAARFHLIDAPSLWYQILLAIRRKTRLPWRVRMEGNEYEMYRLQLARLSCLIPYPCPIKSWLPIIASDTPCKDGFTRSYYSAIYIKNCMFCHCHSCLFVSLFSIRHFEFTM